MIEAFGKVYEVEPKQYVESLVSLFNIQGLTYKGKEAYVKCPFHAHGQERTASASFRLDGDNPGEFYCFGCKTKGLPSSILTKLFGSKQKARLWMSENFKVSEINELRKVSRIEPKVTDNKQEFNLPLSLLDNHTDYFEKRGIPQELVKKYRLMYSPKQDAVIFPVWENDKIIFYQVRYLNHKEGLKWYIPKDSKAKIFGKEYIKTGTVYVCESCFNALTLEKFGYQAVATFGARFDDTRFELLDLPSMKFIIAYDGDFAGRNTAKMLAKFLRDSGRLVEIMDMDNKKDINDFALLSKPEFDKKILEWRRRV